MEKESSYSFRLDPDLKKAYNETCKRLDVPGSQILRQFMKQFIKDNAQQQLDLGGKNGRKNR